VRQEEGRLGRDAHWNRTTYTQGKIDKRSALGRAATRSNITYAASLRTNLKSGVAGVKPSEVRAALKQAAAYDAQIAKHLEDVENGRVERDDRRINQLRRAATETLETVGKRIDPKTGEIKDIAPEVSMTEDTATRGTPGTGGLRYGVAKVSGITNRAKGYLSWAGNTLKEMGWEAVVTSARRAPNGTNTDHDDGAAVDISGMSPAKLREFARIARAAGYNAQVEAPGQKNANGSKSTGWHIHVEDLEDGRGARRQASVPKPRRTVAKNTRTTGKPKGLSEMTEAELQRMMAGG
jgi:hypothetical protein